MAFGLTPYGIAQGYSVKELLRLNGNCFAGVPKDPANLAAGYAAFGREITDRVYTTITVGSNGLYGTTTTPLEYAPNGKVLYFGLQGVSYKSQTGMIVDGRSTFYNTGDTVIATASVAAFKPTADGRLGNKITEIGTRNDFIGLFTDVPKSFGVVQSSEGIVEVVAKSSDGYTTFCYVYVNGSERVYLNPLITNLSPPSFAVGEKARNITSVIDSPVDGELFLVVRVVTKFSAGGTYASGAELWRIRYKTEQSATFVATLPVMSQDTSGGYPIYDDSVMSGTYIVGMAGKRFLLYIQQNISHNGGCHIYEYDIDTNTILGKVVQDIGYGFQPIGVLRNHLTPVGSTVLFGGTNSLYSLLLPTGTSAGEVRTPPNPDQAPCPKLPAPTVCQAMPDNLTRLTLVSWDAVPGATGYVLRRDGVVVKETTRLQWQDTFSGASGLGGTKLPTPGHVYSVCAVNGCGEGAEAFASGAEKIESSSPSLSF